MSRGRMSPNTLAFVQQTNMTVASAHHGDRHQRGWVRVAAILQGLRGKLQQFARHTVTEIAGCGTKRSVSFSELGGRVDALVTKLTRSGVRSGMVVCLQAPNSIDYAVWDLATLSLGAVLLTPLEEQPRDEVERLAEVHGAALIVTGAWQAEGVLPPSIDELPDQVSLRPDARPVGGSDDLHSLVFSSGTSGHLKGIRISRKGTEEVVERFAKAFGLGEGDEHLIFLPFSNYQQRMSVYGCISMGVDLTLCAYQRVFQTLKSSPPTFLIAPPVLYDTALQVAASLGPNRLPQILGGRIRFLITGMAKTNPDTLRVYWDAGLKLYEAYGLTETGMVAWNTEQHTKLGSVGRAIAADEVVLRPDGEVVIKRDNPLSLGYFGPVPDAEEVFTTEGIVTGDYAEVDPEGFITLKGRKKDIIVLNSGKKFHPAEVEEAVQRGAALRDVVVVCDDHDGLVTAIIPRKSNRLGAGDEGAAELRVLRASHALEPHKHVGRVLFTDTDVLGDRQFRTRNLKLDRASVARFFFSSEVQASDSMAQEATS
jgi:long-chain acyl-CoA synthetase